MKDYNIPVIVLAGGHGKRLSPLTLSQPKPALPFLTCRLIDFTLSNCATSGLNHCYILTQYKHEKIAAHISHTWRNSYPCLPPPPGQHYRGTADAVYRNLNCLNDAEHVLILGGDHVYQMDYHDLIDAHLAHDADLTLCTVESPLREASSFGVIEVDDDFRVQKFVEKPASPKPMPHHPDLALVSMGIYVFRVRALVDALQRFSAHDAGFDFGYQIVPSLIETGRVFAYDFYDDSAAGPRYWRDVGGIDSYYSATMDFLDPAPPFAPLRIGTAPSVIEGGTGRIRRTVFCGDVRVAENVEIEDSILLPGVRVGSNVRLRRAIVDEGFKVPDGFEAGWGPNASRRVVVLSGSKETEVKEPKPGKVLRL